jgi:DNA-binding CsgD family transcriptional regulator
MPTDLHQPIHSSAKGYPFPFHLPRHPPRHDAASHPDPDELSAPAVPLAKAPAAPAVDLTKLTLREKEIIFWILRGKPDWQIGEILAISRKTVNFHVEQFKRKLNVATRIQAVVLASRLGLLDDGWSDSLGDAALPADPAGL